MLYTAGRYTAQWAGSDTSICLLFMEVAPQIGVTLTQDLTNVLRFAPLSLRQPRLTAVVAR